LESNIHSNLKLEEIAFYAYEHSVLSVILCEYNTSPGKWLQDKRLQKKPKKP
jgi:hypothetical protein